MHGEYSCNYLLKSRKTCGRSCMKPEGCHEHRNARKRLPCKVCGTPTSSKPGLCRQHASGYYMSQYINRLQNKARMLEEMEKLALVEHSEGADD